MLETPAWETRLEEDKERIHVISTLLLGLGSGQVLEEIQF